MALAQQPPRSLTDHAPAEAQVVESQIQELYTNHHIYAKLQNASNLSIEFYPTQVRLICGHMANCTPHKYRNETHTLPFHFFIIKSCHWQDHDWVCEVEVACRTWVGWETSYKFVSCLSPGRHYPAIKYYPAIITPPWCSAVARANSV